MYCFAIENSTWIYILLLSAALVLSLCLFVTAMIILVIYFYKKHKRPSLPLLPLDPAEAVIPSPTICQVKYEEQSGTGAIYGCEYPDGTFRTLFITSFLEIPNKNEITDVCLVFEDKTIQYLTPDWIKWLWTSPVDKFNVTVIEFSPTALKILSRTKYERLTSDVPVENEDVSVIQYIKESLNFPHGTINKVIGEVIEYSLDTEELSCGFPLLNEQLKVVGIHVNSNKLEERVVLTAIKIGSILDAFKTFITERLGGRTENELRLEKIAQIPKNEFHLIGSGGFGKVYKIKESNSTETFIAVKVVSALGNVDEYKSQVAALQKEYRVVTTLGNHPRIIQFFAIVSDERNYEIMIVMEYMEGGSLADKLQNQQPLSENSVLKYLTQIVEGVSFLHRKEIFHNDIKPANILFNAEDNLKISDFGIAVGSQLQTNSDESATSSHFQGDFHYMSPERLKGADRSAANEGNDKWSVGAIFVHMILGQPLNHLDTITQLKNNISQYKIFINGNPLNNYLQTLNDSDFKKKVISRTLCEEPNRANGQQLLRILFPHSKRLPAEALMSYNSARYHNINIIGMSYNSARDELFLADFKNDVVRAMCVRDAGDLRDVYRATHVYSVSHMSDSDTLLVCSGEEGPDENYANWLVALSRNGSEWREAHRVKTYDDGDMCCALSDSRVLIGQRKSTYMELFRVKSTWFRGKRIARVHRIMVPEQYKCFSATSGSDTRVAMSYEDQSVRVHLLLGDQLEELARIQLKYPSLLLWLADRLLVADFDREKQSSAVIELEVSDTRLERRRELIATSENIHLTSLCAVNDGLAIFDQSRDIVQCSFDEKLVLNRPARLAINSTKASDTLLPSSTVL